MLTVTVYPVDLSVGSAGSDHLCGPDHHHAGAEDTQGSPPSPGCVPLRWYQGKNQLNSLDLHPSDQTENYCSIVKTKRTCSWLVLEMLWFVSSWLCLNISINLQYFTVHHPWWCWTSALTSSYASNIHHLIIQATWVLLCHFSCDVSISRCSHKMLSWCHFQPGISHNITFCMFHNAFLAFHVSFNTIRINILVCHLGANVIEEKMSGNIV